MKSRFAILAVTVLPTIFLASAPSVLGQNSGSAPRVIRAKSHDVSPAWRDMVATSLNLGLPGEHEIENRRPPQIPGADRPAGEDTVFQKQALPPVNTTPGLNVTNN